MQDPNPTTQPAVGTSPELPRMAYSIDETAAILGLSVTTIRRLVARGRLRTIPGIRHRIIPRAQIEKLLGV